MKKSLAILLVLSLALVPLTGLAESSSPTIVKMLAISVNGGHTTIVDRFNATHTDIQIELDNTPSTWSDVATKLTTLTAAGMAPDIVTISSSYYPQFAAQGMLRDLSDYVEANLNKDDYYYNNIEGLYVGDALYGLPISIYTLVNYYNKTLYAAAGIETPSKDWNNTWTMEDWHKIAAQLTSGEKQDKVYGTWIDYQLERTACLIFPEGLDYWNEDGSPNFTDARIREIHQQLYSYLHDEKLMPDSSTTTTTSISQLFADSRLASFIDGTWQVSPLMDSSVDWGVLPTPGGVSVGYIDVYAAMKSTANVDATLEVMAWLAGEEASTIKYEEGAWGAQANRVATEKCMANLYNGLTDEDKQCIFDGLEHCRPLTVFEKWGEFLDGSLLPASQMMAIGEYTVEQGFDALQEEAEFLLK